MRRLFQSHGEKDVIGFWLLGRVRQIIFYTLLLLLPTQFGKHFWPAFSYIEGIRIDYLSPTVYATDILIFLLFLQFLIFNFKFKLKILNFKLVFLAAFLMVGIAFSKNPLAGAYGLVKLLEFVFFGFYTAKALKERNRGVVATIFSLGILAESFLALFQFLNHGSLQGIFYFLGERLFNSQTPGIANASLGGTLILRPYGTFSHPNVLAGYLTIAMTMVLAIFNFQFSIFNWRKMLFLLALLIGTAGLLLTLSRVAILIWLIILAVFLVQKFLNHKSYIIIFLLGLFLTLGFVTPLGLRFTELKLTDESVIQRERLIVESFSMIKNHPLFGVGLNNFLLNLSPHEELQPVHNIFLLILSQTGIVSFLFFVRFIINTYRFIIHKPDAMILLATVLILGMFDHYLLTLQQGQLLFSFVLGFCWMRSK